VLPRSAGEVVAVHVVVGFEVADDGFEGRSPAQLPLDLFGHA